MIPPWTTEGLLPVGVHTATRTEVVDRFGWNSHRLSLLLGLTDALNALARAGCSRFWLDGSFVTTKERPSDWDGCWAYEGVDPSLLDPILFDRSASKSKYLGDIFIAGVELRSGMPFVDFFQHTRDGTPKGIVLLNPQETQ